MLPTLWKRSDLFDDDLRLFVDRWFPERWYGSDTGRDWHPRTDIHETEKEIVIDAELPGIDKKDIHVEVKNNVLTFSGERMYEKKNEGRQNLSERHYGKFSRSFSLPDTVDSDKVKAAFKNGVLTLSLPKKEKALPREINIDIK